jgi:hypothetical protein
LIVASTADHRSRLLEELESLSDERVKALADFAGYLRQREEWESTAEILGNEELAAEEIRESREAWTDGRREEFLSLDELKAKLDV